VALLAVGASAGAREWALAARQRAEAGKWLDRLAFVHRIQGEGRFAEARAILGRVPDGGSEELARSIARAQAELDIVERLDAIRLERGNAPGAARFDDDAVRAYADVFARAGLGAIGDPPADVARRIAATGVRGALVAALDDWAICTQRKEHVSWLLAVARTADPDPWRDRARNPNLWTDVAALQTLAQEDSLTEQPTPLLLVVAGLLAETGGDQVPFLRRVQLAHPDDFWVNFVLAEALGEGDEAIGFYRASLAIRPRTLRVCVNIAIALGRQGRPDEAAEYWGQALSIAPDSAFVRFNMSVAALSRGDFEEALELAEDALALEPSYAQAHGIAGEALFNLGAWADAVDALSEAVELLPDDDPGQARWLPLLLRARQELARTGATSATSDGR
jgi:serine/threonine-protein kinase